MEVFIEQTLYYIDCICSIFSGYAFVLGILSLFRSPCKRWVRPRPSTPRRSWWWRNPGGWKPVAAGCELVLCLGPVGQCWGALPRAWGDLEVPCLGGGAWSHSSSKNHASPRALYARDGRAGAAAEERGHSGKEGTGERRYKFCTDIGIDLIIQKNSICSKTRKLYECNTICPSKCHLHTVLWYSRVH